jgi:hypothetical protein
LILLIKRYSSLNIKNWLIVNWVAKKIIWAHEMFFEQTNFVIGIGRINEELDQK